MTLERGVGVAVTVLTLAILAGLAWFVAQTPGSVFSNEPEHVIPAPTATGGTVLITIRQGESAKAIGDELQRRGVIRSSRLFQALVGMTGVQDALEAGTYEFDPGSPTVEVVRRIAAGKTASREVLIPEGRRAEEVADILDRAGVCRRQDFLDALVASRYKEPFLAETTSTDLEGFIFPATYDFFRDEQPQDVVDAFLRAFQANVADKLQLEGQDLTLDQVVTIASIVEREAVVPSERPLIASVYLNRLRLGLPLQADPTVQYALARDPDNVAKYGYWKTGLTVDDLKVDSPYNTYVHPGLPPGPIASPGFDSMEAVVRPARTNYLFFVARGDGSHVFAETLEEHLRNVEKYQGGGRQ